MVSHSGSGLEVKSASEGCGRASMEAGKVSKAIVNPRETGVENKQDPGGQRCVRKQLFHFKFLFFFSFSYSIFLSIHLLLFE